MLRKENSNNKIKFKLIINVGSMDLKREKKRDYNNVNAINKR